MWVGLLKSYSFCVRLSLDPVKWNAPEYIWKMIRFTKVPFVHNLSHSLALIKEELHGYESMWYGNTCKTRSKASEFVQGMRLRPRKKAAETENKSCSRKRIYCEPQPWTSTGPYSDFPISFSLWVLTTSTALRSGSTGKIQRNFIYLGNVL